jgi:hypothetical protein
MTREDKVKAIVDRLGPQAAGFQSIHLSVLILMDYLTKMFKHGIISEGPVETTELGLKAVALCQEFDWKPTDAEIVTFCKDMVEKTQLESFVIMFRQMRDDQENFIENAKKHIGY